MNPYLIEGPALIAFSAGESSAYMLLKIVEAHGGVLPPDVHVEFNNTGAERWQTLVFLRQVEELAGVKVRRLEFRLKGSDLIGRPDLEQWVAERVPHWTLDESGFEEVGHNSLSTNYEPFEALIRKKGFLPNRAAPYCSIELKSRVSRDFAQQALGWRRWDSIIGLRADEGKRLLGAYARNDSGKDPWRNRCPLDKAGVGKKSHVAPFWGAMPFRLALSNYEGNCELCWKKSRRKITRLLRDGKFDPAWWLAMEAAGLSGPELGNRFNLEFTVADLVEEIRRSPEFAFMGEEEDDEDEACGDFCLSGAEG